MKFVIVLLGLVALGCSAPQPRKVFHEHLEDFLDLIVAEVGDELDQLTEQYVNTEEFIETLNYIRNSNFKDLIYEMESLPEFQAVIEFLENDNIDILYFIDRFNEMLEYKKAKTMRQTARGSLNSYIAESISILPQEKLAALFEEKKATDEEFKVAVENLQSDEWDQIFTALWENEVFQKEVQTLADNGIDVHVLLHEVKAIFGQN